ncbi:MAG: glycosyltransferase family 4 protein, partial [Candidatus Margulisiibacteriota bacterium]
MPLLWIINQSYFPDIDATGQMMTDLAEDLVKNGLQVTVITGQNQKSSPKQEQHNGVNIFRVPVARLNKKVLLYRYLNYISLFPSILTKALFMPKPDYIFIVSSPPFMFLLGWLLKIVKGSKLIFNVQDLYPDIAIKLRLLRNSLLINPIKWLILQSYKRADKLICVGEKMQDLLIKRGVPVKDLAVIHNWADSQLLYPIARADNYFINQAGLAGKFIIQYSGNFGMVHEIDTILQAALTLASNPDIRFLFIGGGVQSDKISLFIKDNNLSNITRLPFQPRKELNLSLNACDVAIVSIKDGFEGTIVPSKLFGIMAV